MCQISWRCFYPLNRSGGREPLSDFRQQEGNLKCPLNRSGGREPPKDDITVAIYMECPLNRSGGREPRFLNCNDALLHGRVR